MQLRYRNGRECSSVCSYTLFMETGEAMRRLAEAFGREIRDGRFQIRNGFKKPAIDAIDQADDDQSADATGRKGVNHV